MAVPPDTATGEPGVPSTVNVTVPVAVLGDTVAVKVTVLPTVEGLAEEESAVVVTWFTICVTVLEVLSP